MVERDDSASTEKSAIEWPPADYRTWVQSQVAKDVYGRAFRWTRYLSIAVVLTLAGSLWKAYGWLQQSLESSISGVVEEQLDDRYPILLTETTRALSFELPNIVKNEISDQQGLAEKATAALGDEVRAYVKSEAFKEVAYAQIEEWLKNSDGVKDVVMESGLERAKDPDASVPARALGLQLFAVLSDSPDPKASREETRRHFRTIMREARAAPEPMPPRLLEAFLESYPFLGPEETHTNSLGLLCIDGKHCSVAADQYVVREALRLISANEQLYEDNLGRFLAVFREEAPKSLYDEYVSAAEGDPDSAVLQDAVRQLAATDDVDFLGLVIERMTDFATRTDPSLRQLGLESLASIDPFADLDPELRGFAIRRLWGDVAFREDAARVFGGDETSVSVPPVAIEEVAGASPSALAGTVLLNLLRTRENKTFSDWDDIVLKRLDGPTLPVTVWMARARMDEAMYGPESWASDQVLKGMAALNAMDAQADTAAVDPQASIAALDAIKGASLPEVQRFATSVAEALGDADRPKAGDAVWELLLSAVQRDVSQDGDFAFLQSVLTPESATADEVRRFVLASLDAPDLGTARSRDTTATLTTAASYVRRLYEQGDPDMHATAASVLAAIDRYEADRCERWAALEDSGLVDAIARGSFSHVETQQPLAALRGDMSWIAHDLEAPGTEIAVGWEGSYELSDTAVPGGLWLRLDSTEDLLLTVTGEGAAGAEIVVMDPGRTQPSQRETLTEDGATVALGSGAHAIAVRRCSATPPQGGTFTLAAALLRDVPIGVNDLATAQRVSRPTSYLFDSGDDGGAVWFSVPLRASDTLLAETRAAAESDGADLLDEPDTYVEIYDAEGVTLLDWNDDEGEGNFSRLEFVAPEDGDYKMRIALCCVNDVTSGTRFKIDLDMLRPEDVVTASVDRFAAPEIPLDAMVVARVSSTDYTYVAVSSPRDALVAFEPPVRLLTAADGGWVQQFEDRSPDGPRRLYRLEGGLRYIAQLSPSFEEQVSLQAVEVAPVAEIAAGVDADPFPSDAPKLLAFAPDGGTLRLRGPTEAIHLALNVPDGPIGPMGVRLVPDDGGPTRDIELLTSDGAWHEAEFSLPEAVGYNLAIGPSETDASTLVGLQIGRGRDLGGFRIGDRVRLGKHEMVDGSDNWSPDMEKYVGCLARIVGDGGEDSADLTTVYVDLSYAEPEYDWVWRTVNLEPVDAAETQPERCAPYVT